jgi:hypothetical protein
MYLIGVKPFAKEKINIFMNETIQLFKTISSNSRPLSQGFCTTKTFEQLFPKFGEISSFPIYKINVITYKKWS